MKTKEHRFLIGVGTIILLMAILISSTICYFNLSKAKASYRLDLSQKQLLLLNNYEYLANSAELISIQDNISSFKTNGKIDLGVSYTLKKISKKLIWENLDVK